MPCGKRETWPACAAAGSAAAGALFPPHPSDGWAVCARGCAPGQRPAHCCFLFTRVNMRESLTGSFELSASYTWVLDFRGALGSTSWPGHGDPGPSCSLKVQLGSSFSSWREGDSQSQLVCCHGTQRMSRGLSLNNLLVSKALNLYFRAPWS